MKLLKSIYASIGLLLAFTSCHSGVEQWDDDPRGNFEALWSIIDSHYCFFDDKDIDWGEIYSKYSPRINDRMTREELFTVCAEMVDELRDGHVNLSSPYATSYYRRWWSDYPQNFNARIIEENYFNFNYRQLGVFTYGFLPDNIAYMRCASFSSGLGEGNIDYILNFFSTARALIIDVRNNGGGNLTNVESLVSRFIKERTLAGYIIHKTGPAHNDFSEPYPYYFNPPKAPHVTWAKPVVVLTNRSTFSAANNFVSIMKLVPGVTVIGSVTGGGSGMPMNSVIPCGWSIRFSACPILDALGNGTEQGVEPSDGYAVDITPEDASNGHDTILDKAIEFIGTL